MAIAARAVGTGASSTGGSIAPVFPTGWQPGDLALAQVNAQTSTIITAPAGWLLLDSQANAEVPAFIHHVYARFLQSGDTAPTYSAAGAAIMLGATTALSGVPVRADPNDVTPVSTQGSGTTMTAPAITPANTGAFVIWFYAQDDNGVTSGTPSGTTVLYQGDTPYNSTVGGGCSIAAAYLTALGTGSSSTGTKAMTSASGTQNMCIAVAINPLSSLSMPPLLRPELTRMPGLFAR